MKRDLVIILIESKTKEAQVVRKLKGGYGKFKEMEDSDDKEESLSITMETKPIDKNIEDNQKENPNSKE